MKIKIRRIESFSWANARIVSSKLVKLSLPSLTDGWRFNFKKYSKQKEYQTFVLVLEETPDVIEGCLIFQMKSNIEPYMAYVEIAPHNRGEGRLYNHVAGCLVAFACRLSFLHGKGDYQGWLAFDVMEESKEDEIKLMAMYSQKYKALRFGVTSMVIPPEGGELLIDYYLN